MFMQHLIPVCSAPMHNTSYLLERPEPRLFVLYAWLSDIRNRDVPSEFRGYGNILVEL